VKPVGTRARSESELVALLAQRYPSPAFVLLPQVRNATGFASRVVRTADAIAVGTWPSRGLEVIGFECKSARSDFVRELEDPEKAEEIARLCDRWYIVAGSDKVATVPEVPTGWGLLVARGEGLVELKEAPKLSPQPMPREFLAALLRRAGDRQPITPPDLGKKIETARAEGIAQGERNAAWDRDHAKGELANLQDRIARFEKASGLKLDQWNAGDVGAAVRFVINARLPHARSDLEILAKRLAELGHMTTALLEHVPAVETPDLDKIIGRGPTHPRPTPKPRVPVLDPPYSPPVEDASPDGKGPSTDAPPPADSIVRTVDSGSPAE
jgi:hypothetical protein